MVNSNISKNQNSNIIPRSVPKAQNMYFLEFILVLFFFVYYLLPVVNSVVSYMIPLFIGIAYLMYLFLREPYWRTPIMVFLAIVVGIALLYYLLTSTSTVSTSASNYALKRITSKMYQYFMMFFPVCLFVRIYTKASYRQKRVLYWIAVIMFSVVFINTFVELMINESATKDWSGFIEQSENNVGTYSFVYAVPMLVSALVSLLYTQKGLGRKFGIVALIAVLFVFLLSAQYTLALLISIIGIALQISANMRSVATKLLLWMFFIGLLFLLPTMLEFLANTIESEQMAIRLSELASFFGSGDASGYNLNGRLELYWKSIQAFFSSPIIGNRKLSFDGHATLLTTPADIGIFGLVALILLISKSKKYVSAFMGERKKQFAPVVMCLIIMGLTNPIHGAPTALFAVWLLAPMIIKIGDNNNG